jgi:hypothetical protein
MVKVDSVDSPRRGRQDPPMPETVSVDSSASLGSSFAAALALKDFDRIRDLLHPEIDFRGLTPSRNWEAEDADAVIDGILRLWFEDSDEILELLHLETGAFADRERVGYRFLVRNPEGLFEVEQQAYISERDGRIGWMRVVCSGPRPVEGE